MDKKIKKITPKSSFSTSIKERRRTIHSPFAAGTINEKTLRYVFFETKASSSLLSSWSSPSIHHMQSGSCLLHYGQPAPPLNTHGSSLRERGEVGERGVHVTGCTPVEEEGVEGARVCRSSWVYSFYLHLKSLLVFLFNMQVFPGSIAPPTIAG